MCSNARFRLVAASSGEREKQHQYAHVLSSIVNLEFRKEVALIPRRDTVAACDSGTSFHHPSIEASLKA